MLADQIDFVIGIDTHKLAHSAALVNPVGGLLGVQELDANRAGYGAVLNWANAMTNGRRVWAVEGTGSYGAGLVAYLERQGELVVEVERPERRRRGAKSDQLDALAAARHALSKEHLARPRRGAARDGIRVLLSSREGAVRAATQARNQLKALLLTGDESLRGELSRLSDEQLLRRCRNLRRSAGQDVRRRALTMALSRIAGRIAALESEAKAYERELEGLTQQRLPGLRAEMGVGPWVAAQLVTSFSHGERFRSEAAFASLAGTAPIAASSGQTQRHRLNRGGDRQLNRALHQVVITRLRLDPSTQAYAARRRHEGKSDAEIRRCLKRFIARQIFRRLRSLDLGT